jgi:chemotaxis protein MotA
MDIAIGPGLTAGAIVLLSLILMGGNLGMFADSHAFIVIFGRSFAAP